MANSRVRITEGSGVYLDEESLTVDGYTVNRGRFEIAGAGATDLVLPVAHDAVDAGNPLKIGGKSSINLPSAVSADSDRVDAAFTRQGELYVAATPMLGSYYVPGYGRAPLMVSYQESASIVDTVGMQLVAAGGSGVYTYVVAVRFIWASGGTAWQIRKGTVSGSVVWVGQTNTTNMEAREEAPFPQYIAKSNANEALWLKVTTTTTTSTAIVYCRYVQATV